MVDGKITVAMMLTGDSVDSDVKMTGSDKMNLRDVLFNALRPICDGLLIIENCGCDNCEMSVRVAKAVIGMLQAEGDTAVVKTVGGSALDGTRH